MWMPNIRREQLMVRVLAPFCDRVARVLCPQFVEHALGKPFVDQRIRQSSDICRPCRAAGLIFPPANAMQMFVETIGKSLRPREKLWGNVGSKNPLKLISCPVFLVACSFV